LRASFLTSTEENKGRDGDFDFSLVLSEQWFSAKSVEGLSLAGRRGYELKRHLVIEVEGKKEAECDRLNGRAADPETKGPDVTVSMRRRYT
jgi:hypothetical protein